MKYLLDKLISIRQLRNRGIRALTILATEMGMEGAMAVKRVVEAHDVIKMLRASRDNGDKKVDKALEEVEKWEHKSKPAEAAILEIIKSLH